MTMDILWQSLWPWRGAALAFVVALGLAWLGRQLGRLGPALAASAVGLGVLAGWWLVFGLLTASPRQLAERLPMLLLAMVVLAALLGLPARRWSRLAPALAALALLVAGWWMAGAPLTVADGQRAVPVLLGVAALGWVLALRATPMHAPFAAAALLAGLWAAAMPGPQLVLGAALLAAALGGMGAASPLGAVAAVPLAAGMAALAAVPVIARGGVADGFVAAAPVAVLWLGPWLATLLPGRLPRRLAPGLGAVLAAAPCVAAAYLLR